MTTFNRGCILDPRLRQRGQCSDAGLLAVVGAPASPPMGIFLTLAAARLLVSRQKDKTSHSLASLDALLGSATLVLICCQE